MKKLLLASIFSIVMSTSSYSQQSSPIFDFSFPVKCGPTFTIFSMFENLYTKAKIIGLNKGQDVTTTIHINEKTGAFAITQSNLQEITCVIAIGENNGLLSEKDFKEM